MKVIIIGKGSGWEKAPTFIEDGEIWGVNNVCLRRIVDLAFNMHDLDKHKDHYLFQQTINHVNVCDIPIVTQKKYKHIHTSIPFPLDYFDRQYFTNSIDYMVAFALYCPYFLPRTVTNIEMYGVVMGIGTEYSIQRPSLEYWIGRAEGAGIKVFLHDPTFVCRSPKGLYGYDWDEEMMAHVQARSENKP